MKPLPKLLRPPQLLGYVCFLLLGVAWKAEGNGQQGVHERLAKRRREQRTRGEYRDRRKGTTSADCDNDNGDGDYPGYCPRGRYCRCATGFIVCYRSRHLAVQSLTRRQPFRFEMGTHDYHVATRCNFFFIGGLKPR